MSHLLQANDGFGVKAFIAVRLGERFCYRAEPRFRRAALFGERVEKRAWYPYHK